MVANALNVSGANNESEEKDDKPHCFSIVPAGHIGGGFSFLHDPAELRNNCRLTKDRHTAGMVSTAEQHSKISKRYDKLADDGFRFVRKLAHAPRDQDFAGEMPGGTG